MIDASYVTAFAMLLIGAPTLVGIVSPLLAPVIRELEKMRLERLRNLQEEAQKLASASDGRELEKAQEKLNVATKEYERVKSTTYYLDFSIFAGIVVSGICSLALLSLFTSSATGQLTTTYQILFGVAVSLFWFESVFLLIIVLFYIISIRRKVAEGLETKRRAGGFLVPKPFSKYGKKKSKG
jgi:hypothetical protein